MRTEAEIRADERERCIKILEAEIERGKSMLALWKDGRPVFDGAMTQAGIQTIRYCIEKLMRGGDGT